MKLSVSSSQGEPIEITAVTTCDLVKQFRDHYKLSNGDFRIVNHHKDNAFMFPDDESIDKYFEEDERVMIVELGYDV